MPRSLESLLEPLWLPAKELLLAQLATEARAGLGADALEELRTLLEKCSPRGLLLFIRELTWASPPPGCSNGSQGSAQAHLDGLQLLLLKVAVLGNAQALDERLGCRGSACVECLLLQATVEDLMQACRDFDTDPDEAFARFSDAHAEVAIALASSEVEAPLDTMRSLSPREMVGIAKLLVSSQVLPFNADTSDTFSAKLSDKLKDPTSLIVPLLAEIEVRQLSGPQNTLCNPVHSPPRA